MKKYIAVFEVPDGYKPTDYLENADGWFTDEEGNRCTVGTKLEEVKQGEWKHICGDEWCCTECGHVITTEGSWEHPLSIGAYHCENCGADMRKGDKT